MWTRRTFLWATLQAWVVGGLATGANVLSGCDAPDACVDPASLSTGQASLRASFHYVPRSPHGDAKRCRDCRFFRASPGDAKGCGDCEILQGPVNGLGACDSWTERA